MYNVEIGNENKYEIKNHKYFDTNVINKSKFQSYNSFCWFLSPLHSFFSLYRHHQFMRLNDVSLKPFDIFKDWTMLL